MNQNKNNPDNQLEIELSEEIAQGTYSNLAIISHSSSEFVLDFIRVVPGMPKAKVKSRIILTPDHAKRLLSALEENIEKFEKMNGKVSINNENLGFMPPLGGIGQA
jgi:predicted transcriptional regulator